MKKTIAYIYRVKTTDKIDNLIIQFVGTQRVAWNKILYFQIDRFKLSEKKLSHVQCTNLLPQMKQQDETNWLNQIPFKTLQQILKNLDRAKLVA